MNKDPDRYCEVYREMAQVIGEAATIKLWKNYAGVCVNFPQRLYSQEYTRQYIKMHMDSMKVAEIARAVSLSDRRVRQIMREIREDSEH